MSEQSVVDGLGAFPIVQLAVVAVIGISAAMAIRSGSKSKSSGPEPAWFFDGPITKALEYLQGCYRLLGEIRTENARYANERNEKTDEIIELLRDIKEQRRR